MYGYVTYVRKVTISQLITIFSALLQDMAQIQHVSRETSGDPRQEEPPSTPAATVSPPEKRAIRTLEGIVKKMSDVTAATAVVAPHDGVATAASCPAMEAAGEDEDDSLSVSESPLIGSALRKRKADAQVSDSGGSASPAESSKHLHHSIRFLW